MFNDCLKNPIHAAKNLIARWRYGAGPCDTYSLFYWIAPKIVRWLKSYKKDNDRRFGGYPCAFTQEGDKNDEGSQRWSDALNEMIYGFQYTFDDPDFVPAEYERAEKGRELFGKYFDHLWR